MVEKKIYGEDSWQKTFSTFDPAYTAFSGLLSGLPILSNRMPILYTLYPHKFWTPQTFCKICAKMNKYAYEINP